MEPFGILCRPGELAIGPRACATGGDSAFDETGVQPGDLTVYVDSRNGFPDGAGTIDDPVDSLAAAFALILGDKDGAYSVVMAPGDYWGSEIPALEYEAKTVRFLGACHEDTVLYLEDYFHLRDADQSIEMHRLHLLGTSVIANGIRSFETEDCVWESTGGIAPHLLSVEGVAGSSASLKVQRCTFLGTWTGVNGQWLDTMLVRGNRFEGQTENGITARNVVQVDILENRIELAIEANPDTSANVSLLGAFPDDAVIRIERNWFKAHGGPGITVDLGDEGDPRAPNVGQLIEITGNSIVASKGPAINVNRIRAVEALSNRIDGKGQSWGGAGIQVYQVENLDIRDILVRAVMTSGIELADVGLAMINGGSIQDCLGTAISSSDDVGTRQLEVAGIRLAGNQRGVFADGGRVRIADSAVASNAHQGVYVRGPGRADLNTNHVIGNGSTGIALVALGGQDPGLSEAAPNLAHEVSGNRVESNVGVGILVVAGGEGAIRMADNTVRATAPGEISNTSIPFTVADGICVVTGTNGVGSTVLLSGGNDIVMNPRLGIVAHGDGTTLRGGSQEVPEADRVTGNGFGGYLGVPPADRTWDIVVQAGAVPDGVDATQPPEPVPGPEELGEGGDPR